MSANPTTMDYKPPEVWETHSRLEKTPRGSECLLFSGLGSHSGWANFLGFSCETFVVKEAAKATTHFVTKP